MKIKGSLKTIWVFLKKIYIWIFKKEKDIDIKLKKAKIFEKRWIGWYYIIKSLFYILVIFIIILFLISIIDPNYRITIGGININLETLKAFF